MKLPGVAKRAGWNLVDQVISSGTNAVLSFLVARSVDEQNFGGFAVAFTVFTLGIGISRALASSPLGIKFSDAGKDEFRRASAAAVGTAFAIGVVSGVGCVIAGLLIGQAAGHALLALGVVFPALLVQDAWRYVFFAEGRPAAAAANDAVWAVLQLGAVIALVAVGMSAVGPLVLVWGGSALAAAALGIRQARVLPRPDRALTWARTHRRTTGFMVAEFATVQGAQQGALLLIAGIASLEAIGSLRGVQVLLGPTTILAVAAISFAVPEFARRRSRLSARQWVQGGMAVSLAICAAGFVWGLVFVLLPDSVGVALLGDTWPGTSAILWPTIASQAGGTLSLGAAIMLIAMDRTSVTFSLNLLLAPLIFAGGVVGVLLDGAYGAAWGFGIANWLILIPFWMRLRREARAFVARRDSGSAAGLPEPESASS